jgi:HEAT repeat protein
MKRVRWTIILALLGFLIAGLIIWSVSSKEPVYQGRSLSSWLDEWGHASNNRTNHAAIAIRAIGSNGVPFLLARISRNESTNEIIFWRFAEKFVPDAWNPLYRDTPRELTAAEAINLLGVEAKSAFPTLTNLFSHKINLVATSVGLAGLGHEGVTVLLEALTNKDWLVRNFAASALGEANSDLDKVIPALIEITRMKCTKQEDYLVVDGAGIGLMQLQKQSETVVPALAQLISSPDNTTRLLAAAFLRGFGTDAKAAVPVLLKARTDVNAGVRDAAENALKEIDPQAAAQSQP